MTLSNPNNRIARFNFYYIGDIPKNVEMGYINETDINIPPIETGINLEKIETTGSSNTYKIRIDNSSNNSVTIKLGVSVGLDYNDLTLPNDGHLFEELQYPLVSEVVLKNPGVKGSTYDDGYDTFITGEDLNNYIWYSGEYIKFGVDENNLYRIVSHKTEGLTKITSAEPLKENGSFKTLAFDKNSNMDYSSTNTIGAFLNGEYLNSGKYLTTNQVMMIEDNTTWYLGTVDSGMNYKLAKYKDVDMKEYVPSITAKVGLLRYGELMTGQFSKYEKNSAYWTLTKSKPKEQRMRRIDNQSSSGFGYKANGVLSIKSSMNLKSNVFITSGDGTLQNPFTIELSSN